MDLIAYLLIDIYCVCNYIYPFFLGHLTFPGETTVSYLTVYMDSTREMEMIGILGHDSALYGYTGQGTILANEMNFVMNHATGAGSIDRPVSQGKESGEKDKGSKISNRGRDG